MYNDNLKTQVIGTLKIYDKDTGTTLVSKRNAIHPGNMAYVMASALAGKSLSVTDVDAAPTINWMAFGNGGSSSTTTLSYKSPQISDIYDELPLSSSASTLYARTYEQKATNVVYYPGEEMTTGEVVPDRTSKIIFSVDIKHDEYQRIQRERNNSSISTPSSDNSTDTLSVTQFTIDEIALVAGDGGDDFVEDNALMLTHVTFHPVLLSANRTIVVDYTITIQIS